MAQTILVTGGAGYIGSHTAVALLERGDRVVVLDDFSRGTRAALERVQAVGGGWIETEAGDLCDAAFVDGVFTRWRPDAVVHLAAFKSVEESVRDPASYERVNVGGTEVLAGAMAAHGVRRIANASTAAIYGEVAGDAGLTEDSPIGPINPYSQTKYLAEQLLEARGAALGWGVVHLRFFNVCGAHPSGQLGEFVDRPQNLMPILLAATIENTPVPVFGTDWPTRDGTCIRDYIHVMDIVSGIEAALRNTHGAGARVYNLGTGTGSTVLEVIEAVERATGLPLERKLADRRPGDVAISVANARRAAEELDWHPLFTLDEMARSAWAWMHTLAADGGR